jgi:hypothetical protein
MAGMRSQQKPPAEKKDNPADEAMKALQAVFEVFKKLQERMGGGSDPNIEAAKDNLKKFAATALKQDPSALEGGVAPGKGAESAPPPPPTAEGSATPPPPAPEGMPGQ